MKKILIITSICFMHTFASAQITDTLQWLNTNLQQQQLVYKDKPLKNVFDTLHKYGLKNEIKEYTAPVYINTYAGYKGKQTKDTMFINVLTFYFADISINSNIRDLHSELFFQNFRNKTNLTLNTHVKYFKVFFKQVVPYPKIIAESDNGSNVWKPFVEYFWGKYIIDKIETGEY